MKIKLTPLDRLFSQYIKQRDQVCQRCGGMSGLQTSHFVGRRKLSVRWNEDNCCLLCMGCHMYFHANPLEHTEWYCQKIGDERFTLLRIQANQPCKPDERIVKLYLQEEIKKLGESAEWANT